MIVQIQSIIMAIYVLLAGFFYGGQEKVEIKCDIPSGIYEYAAGDEININIFCENKGRPFVYSKDAMREELIESVRIFKVENGKEYKIDYTPSENGEDDGYQDVIETPFSSKEVLIKNGYKEESSRQYTVSEYAPKGEYSITICFAGHYETFKNVITVK